MSLIYFINFNFKLLSLLGHLLLLEPPYPFMMVTYLQIPLNTEVYMVGALQYLMMTRRNIANLVHLVFQFIYAPVPFTCLPLSTFLDTYKAH